MIQRIHRLLGVPSLLLAVLFVSAGSAHAQLTNFFVATSGNDGNAGTDPTLPLQTIGRAVVLAGGSAARITVSPGTYQVPATPGFLNLPAGTVLESNDGPFSTTIQGALGREVIRLNPGGLGTRSEVRGFTITGGQ